MEHLTAEGNIKQYSTLDVGLVALNKGDIDGWLFQQHQQSMTLIFLNLIILPRENFDLDPRIIHGTNVIAFPLGEEYHSLIEITNQVTKENKKNENIAKWQQKVTELSREAIEE